MLGDDELLAARASAHKSHAHDLLRISELELSLARWQQRLHTMSESLHRCELLEADEASSPSHAQPTLPSAAHADGGSPPQPSIMGPPPPRAPRTQQLPPPPPPPPPPPFAPPPPIQAAPRAYHTAPRSPPIQSPPTRPSE